MTTVTTTLVSGQNAHVGAVSSRGEYSVSVGSGIQGPTGNTGTSITAANVVSGNLVITFSNSATVDAGRVTGSNGAAGANGAAANTGNVTFTNTTISTSLANASLIIETRHIDPSASPAINSTSSWTFDKTGTITFPDSTVQTTAYTGTANAASYLGGVAANQYAYANQITTYTLPAADTTTLGGVKVDGTTIVIASNTISANLTNYATTSSLSSYQTSTGLASNVATLTANNTSYLGGIAANQYAYANQIVTYTLPTASTTTLGGVKVDGTTIIIAANGVISSSGSGSFTNGQSISVAGLTVTGSLTANGTTGTAGQVLASNGTALYWSTVASGSVNVAATYAWTNTHTFSNSVTYSGSAVAPSSNTLGTALGTSTQRWILNANTINLSGAATLTSATFTGAVSGITTLAAGNTTITGFANVTSTIQGGSSLTIAGSLAGVTTAAMGNTTITGFANVSTTFQVTGAATFSNTVTVAANISGTSANVTITAGTFTTTFANNGVVTFPANVAFGNTTITANDSVGTSGQFLTSGATGNVYWSSIDLSGYVTTSSLTSNLANYQTTAGLSANVATLTANNSTNLNGQPASYYIYTLPQANSSALGGVKVDGSTISINATSGVLFTTQNLSNTGSVTFANTTVTNNLTVSNTVFAAAINEAYSTYSTAISASPTITFDCTAGNIWNVTSTASSNWTANFTNLALSNNYSTGITMIVNQGATAYIPSAIQVESNAVTINWQGGATPTGSANKKDVFAFSVMQTGTNTYLVFGQMVSFG